MRSHRRRACRLLTSTVRAWTAALILSASSALSWSGCAWLHARPRQQLAGTLQELLPHADRDHFVYIAQRPSGGATTLQVEHITALDERGTFEVTMSENGTETGRLRARDDGNRILLLEEDDLVRDLRLSYDPPLPYLEAPLFTGESRTTSTARVSRLSDGQVAGSVRVTQQMSVGAAGGIRTVLGTYPQPIVVRIARTLQGPDGDIEVDTTMFLVPGIGEVRSVGGPAGAPALQRELACALIGSRAIGDCHQLNVQTPEANHAGSADDQ